VNVRRWWICRKVLYRSATSKQGSWQCSCLLLQQAAHGSRKATAGPARQPVWLQQSVSSRPSMLCYAVVSLSTEGNAKTLWGIPRNTSKTDVSHRVKTNKWYAFSFSHQCSVRISPLPYTCHMPCQSHLPSFYRPDNIKWGMQVEYCQNKPQILHHEMLMYVGMVGQLHASWNPLGDGSKDFVYPEFVSDLSQRS